jgi:O-Antigen ligase
MGRKNFKKTGIVQPAHAAATPTKGRDSAAQQEWLRRLLLGVVTALVVARPFVLGEDPGLNSQLSGAATLIVSMTWLLVAVGTGAWHWWSGQPAPRVHPVEWCLAALAALAFLTAQTSAHYRFPARLIAWEWLIFLLVFALVRRLARTSAERGYLLAALLATGVSLSVYAIYQYAVELPRMRAALESPEALSKEVARYNVYMPVGDPRLAGWMERLQQNNVFATYAHPNSFAGLLALLMPATVGWALLVWLRERRWTWQVCCAAAAAALVLAALWLTHSRGAILGSMLAALLLIPFVRVPLLAERRGLVAGVGLAVLLLLGGLALTPVGAAGLQKARTSLGLRGDYWTATEAMIRDHVWWGVGWGGFSRFYPRYMLATAFEKIQDPHNLFLETWVCGGLLAFLALVGALAAFYYSWFRSVRQTPTEAEVGPSEIRWEFYWGGAAGLVVAFLLRAGDLGSGQILTEGVLSVVRATVWFGVFAGFTSIPKVGRTLVLTMGLGVTALLCNLLISGGIAQPSVAQPLWVVAALALPVMTTVQFPAWRAALGLAASLVLVVVFGFAVYEPLWRVDTLLAEARRHYGEDDMPGWRNQVKQRWLAALQTQNPRVIEPAFRESNQYLKQHILGPFERAIEVGTGDAKLPAELAQWYEEQWSLFPDNDDLGRKAVDMARKVQALDPDSRDGFSLEAELQTRRAERSPKNAQEHRQEALRATQAAVDRDPTEASLHYELAELFFTLQDDASGKREASRALELNDLSEKLGRKLADPQVKTLRQRLGLPPLQ